MKFLYEYRTSDNVRHNGVVAAPNREAAFAALKAQGIRPGYLAEAPGFFNKLFGKGKRWMAIVLLAIAAVAGWLLVVGDDEPNWEERSQIYGDPALLRQLSKDNWAAVFPDPADRALAAYAQPGSTAAFPTLADPALAMKADVPLSPDDSDVARKMKRIVNGMKREMRAYVAAGGTPVDYFERLGIRQKAEESIYLRAKQELRLNDDPVLWETRNGMLRKMGLPMIDSE